MNYFHSQHFRTFRIAPLYVSAATLAVSLLAGCSEADDPGAGRTGPAMFAPANVSSTLPANVEPETPPSGMQQPDTSAPADSSSSGEGPADDLTLSGGDEASTGGDEQSAPDEPSVEDPDDDLAGCSVFANPGDRADGDVNVDLAQEFQTITGFGGITMVPFFSGSVLTAGQVDIAFGLEPGQLGLSILRYPLSDNPAEWDDELPAAQRAVELGATVMASPWTPPANLKTNGSTVGGRLAPENYEAYADHLLDFRQFMEDRNVPIAAISVQNEPDIEVTYDSCFWSPQEISSFLVEQGPRFGDTKVIASESFNFDRTETDPLLQDPEVSAQFDIVAGHLYGTPGGPFDYELAREQGKEVWMTEHYTDSGNEPDRANFWPLALGVASEMTASMKANYNAYIWWYIRRGYGLILDNEQVSKRGWLFSQFSRFVRPGFVRVAATDSQGVRVTAFKDGLENLVIVALNESDQAQAINLDVFGSCADSFDQFTTSETKNRQEDASVTLEQGRAALTLDAQSLTTFVSRPITPAAN